MEEKAINIFKDVSFNCLRVPTRSEIIQIVAMKKFIEKLERKDKGMSFCQVNKIPITNHEMSFDILISQKCKGPIATFNAIKKVSNILILFGFSKLIIFIISVEENKQTNKKAEAKD